MYIHHLLIWPNISLAFILNHFIYFTKETTLKQIYILSYWINVEILTHNSYTE